MSALALVLAALLVSTPVAHPSMAPGVTDTATDPTTAAPSIVSVYPNPLADGDTGEFVVLSVPEPTTLTLRDGETAVERRLRSGTVALSADPTATRALTSARVVGVEGLSLANSGERLRVVVENRTVDTIVYEDAPAGERLVRDDDGFEWRPLGYDPRPVVERGAAQATAFLLPDSPAVPLRTLRAADDRILLAGYTFSSRRITRALAAASRRGVRVRVLVDDAPVGGMTRRQARLLDDLAAAGVEVRVIGGEGARFSYHHPKYAVVDHAALVLTENWKPAGTGGASSRGWGVRVDSPMLAADLVALFAADAAGRDVTSWTRFRRGRRFEPSTPANGSFPTRQEPERLRVERVRLLTAPGNAEKAVVAELDASEDRIDVVQPALEREHPFTAALFRAARRGVEVRVLLSGVWYAREENEATVEWLNRRADREGLPLEAKLARPGSRFEKIHAKGVVVDDTVLVGSLNWNRHATRENREVVLALDGSEAASYYRRAFERDWQGGRAPPLLLGLAVVAGVAVALLAWRRLRFERSVSG